ncbi:MAG TPA: flagellar hook-associated protein FlgK [Stellaceae bacterium]|nr:flagellar hook-associated protein FlgK [Stellaceae bacterium]
MASLTQVAEIGASGIEAATIAMQTVSTNTANANTPGYNVESVVQAELPGSGSTPGDGTEVTSVQRAFDQFIYQAVVQASSANQAAQVVETNSQNLAAAFPVASGGAGGLGASISSFFAAASTLSQNPTSEPDRQALLGQAQSLAGAFNSVGGQVASGIATINSELTASVQQVNTLSAQIADLNQQIAQQSGGNPPNALLDQRDELVQQLAQQVGVTVLQGANGTVDVYTASGAALVAGSTSYQLAATPSAYGDGAIDITYVPNGQDLTGSLSGGELGGLVVSRSQLIAAQDGIGALAAGLAAAVNDQQSLGLDTAGQLGQPLFSVAGPAVYAASSNQGTGTLSAAITDPAQFTAAEFVLTKTAGGFSATDTTTGQTTTLGNGPTLSLDGMTISVSGSAATGDSFAIEPTATAAQTLAVTTSDPSAIAAAAAYVVTPGAIGAGGAVTDNNQGNVAVSIGGPVASGSLASGAVIVPASAFGQNLSIVFTSATDFAIETSAGTVLASGSVSATSGAEIAIAYPSPPAPAGTAETVTLSAGTAAAGDTFTLTPGGSGSSGNIAALAGLANQPIIGGQSLGDAYAALVTTIGSNGADASAAATSAQGVLTLAQQNQQSVSGVNLDQQATDLVAYQQAYQAAAQVIASAQLMFQSLITALEAA